MSSSDTRLPHELMAGGSSVAIIARPIQAGVFAHKPSSQTREVEVGPHRGRTETYYLAACTVEQDIASEAYVVSAPWADHMGAVACTEPACFAEAVTAR